MFKETLELNGKPYIVKLTRKAKVEIEERQKKKNREIAKNEDDIEAMSYLDQLDGMQDEMNKIEKMKDGDKKTQRTLEYTKKYLPMVMKVQASNVIEAPLTPYELVYILIRCNPKNQELTKEDYEMGLFELEEELGLIELEKKFKEMYDKVFHEIQLINQALNTPMDQQQKSIN